MGAACGLDRGTASSENHSLSTRKYGLCREAREWLASSTDFALAEAANAGRAFRSRGWGLARRCRGAYETRFSWSLTSGHFARDGDWCFPGALELASINSGHVVHRRGPSAHASSHHLGCARGMYLGRSQHTDDFRHPGYWSKHCFSSVEFKQSAGHIVGGYFL